jgi:hypothetical protein
VSAPHRQKLDTPALPRAMSLTAGGLVANLS